MKIIKINKTQQKITIDAKTQREDICIIGKKGGKLELEIVLDKTQLTSNIYGIIMGKEDQIYDLKITSNHKAPSCTSYVYIKSILMDKSKFHFNGMIKIAPKAQLSDAYLKNDNLVIGENAYVDSSPQLEIQADDVKASHGVTIRTINEIEKYYLKSRGLSTNQAQQMLIHGFINDLTQKAQLPTNIINKQ